MNELVIAGNINNEEKREEVCFRGLKLINDPLKLDITEEANALLIDIYNRDNRDLNRKLSIHHVSKINRIVKNFEFMGRENQNTFYSSMCDFIDWLKKIDHDTLLEELKERNKRRLRENKKQKRIETANDIKSRLFNEINDFKKGFEV